jgi:hypothetical protein
MGESFLIILWPITAKESNRTDGMPTMSISTNPSSHCKNFHSVNGGSIIMLTDLRHLAKSCTYPLEVPTMDKSLATRRGLAMESIRP